MPDIRVQDEQGTTHVFPDGSTPEAIAQAMGVKPPQQIPDAISQSRASLASKVQPIPANALQRYSEVTTGMQHPFQEIGREAKDIYQRPVEGLKSMGELVGLPRGLWSDPANQIQNIGGTGIPGMLFGERGVIKDPVGFGQQITGANQAAEDVRNKNYGAIPGDIAGGLTNLAFLKRPAEAGGAELSQMAQNAKGGIADVIRQPNNKLTPAATAGARIAGAAAGHALGVPGYGELAGIFTGPSLADAFLPKRPEPTNFRGGAFTEQEPLTGQSVPMNQSPNYSLFKQAQKAGPAAKVVSPQEAATEPRFSGSEGRAATWTNEDVIRLAGQGNRDAISQAIRRGLPLPANARYVMGDPDISRAVYNPRETTTFTPEGTPIRNMENPNKPPSSKKRILPWEPR